ncbi:MAG: DUF2281 domain-containing protein [Treponema sp.]|jgi:hypothetical protein|nr:DUF2281 domain-containing protein [Treponema sp.]
MNQQVELMKIIDRLPSHYLGEMIDFAGYLQHKALNGNKPLVDKVESLKERTFGCAKGQFKMADDFDAPLDDFKDYM